MLPVILMTPVQVKKQIAKEAKLRRLELNLSRKTLSLKSGVTESSIKRFERLGEISLDSLVKIAFVLDCLNEFSQLFHPKPRKISLHDKKHERHRGRQ